MKRILPLLFLFAASLVAGDVEVVFSRSGQVQDTILRHLNQTKQTCYLAIFDFTDGVLAAKLVALHKRGVDVRVVLDSRQAKGPHSEAAFLVENLGADRVRVAKGFKGGIMHHKFAILDGKTVLTGSYNWTDSARERNAENLIVLVGEGIAGQFLKEWNEVWR